ncbi:MAG: zapA [Gammaproteobacteria bacterium]|nr:zapA [Gammaproteobacteria bacterium]
MIETAIEIMGKTYQISCPESEINSLHCAAQYLEEKMRLMRESGVLSFDRIAMITALNITHQLLLLEQKKNERTLMINQRLTELKNKIDNALALSIPRELQSAD